MFNVLVFVAVYLLVGVVATVITGIVIGFIWKNKGDGVLRTKLYLEVDREIKEENSSDFFHRKILPIIGVIIWPLCLVFVILVAFCITKMDHQELIDEIGEEAKEG